MFFVLLILRTFGYPILNLGSILVANQTQEWSYFKLNSSEIPEGFYRLTLAYEASLDHVLVLSISSTSVPVFQDGQVLADLTDYDGWELRRSQQFLTFASSFIGEELIIGVGNPEQNQVEIPYSLIIEHSSEALCPNDCSVNGFCNYMQCECFEGFIGYDCLTPADPIQENAKSLYEVLGDTYTYAYFDILDKDSLKIDYEWEGGSFYVMIDWKRNGNLELPSLNEAYYIDYLDESLERYSHTIDLSSEEAEILYFAFTNVNPSSSNNIYIAVEGESSEDKKETPVAVITIIVTSGTIFLSWVICIFCKFREKEKVADSYKVDFLDRISGPCEISEGCQFPTCAICLEEFELKQVVRKLICGHIFHTSCIEEWLSNKAICCLCNQSFLLGNNATVMVDPSVEFNHNEDDNHSEVRIEIL